MKIYEEVPVPSAPANAMFFKRPHAQAFLQTVVTLFLIVYVEVIGSYIHLQPVQKTLHVPTPSMGQDMHHPSYN